MTSSLGRVLARTFFASAVLAAGTGRAGAQQEEEVPPYEPPADEAENAAETIYRFELGLYGGGHFFAKEHGLRPFDNDPEYLSPKDGGAFGFRLSFNVNAHVAFEGDVWWTPTRTRSLIEGNKTKLHVFGYRGAVLVDFVGRGPFRPFLQVGFGGMSSIVDDESVLPNDQDPMVHAGLGAKIFFTPRVGLRLDGIVMGPPAFASDIIKIGDETAFGGPDFQVLGTLFFNFLAAASPTQQVIVKKETVMVQPSGPIDPDGDGIAGENDKCPKLAEDRDGYEDDDGCPESDNDQDGIPDAQDRCPLQPETVNGVDDEDGCPEEDADQDGFLGSADKCPEAPETKNGFEDNDGCPDEIPQTIKNFTGVIEGINFKSGSATILRGSFNVLDRAVRVLMEYPDIRLEIQGHTDNRGRAAYNLRLSQQRAEAVRTYLLSKGISSNRLTAVGYGQEHPIADNSSRSGRAANRRTEFKLITQ